MRRFVRQMPDACFYATAVGVGVAFTTAPSAVAGLGLSPMICGAALIVAGVALIVSMRTR